MCLFGGILSKMMSRESIQRKKQVGVRIHNAILYSLRIPEKILHGIDFFELPAENIGTRSSKQKSRDFE